MVHIAFNTIGTVLFMLVMTLMQRFAVFGAEYWVRTVDSGSIANFQTVFNLITALVLIPFADWLVKLSMMMGQSIGFGLWTAAPSPISRRSLT